MVDIVVIGGGGHAKVTISILKKLKSYRILGYTDLEDRGALLGVSFLGCDDRLTQLRDEYSCCAAVIGIGMLNDSGKLKRVEIFQLLKSLGFQMPPIVSPDAVVNEGVKIDSGTVVMDGVVINSGTSVGKGVILNTHCSIEHDCEIGSFTHIAPGAILSGDVVVAKEVLVGAGAVVCQNKLIGDDCVIGAGAVVITDCTDSGTYAGVPAKRIK
ncbi:MAG: acetyltransferase [Planctomycetota bacterium]|jgi:sugar O-acyltransferase (sialic acid O-acetyltransferase NeuD family)